MIRGWASIKLSKFNFLFKNEPLLKTANRENSAAIFECLDLIYQSYLLNPNQESKLNVDEFSRFSGAKKLKALIEKY